MQEDGGQRKRVKLSHLSETLRVVDELRKASSSESVASMDALLAELKGHNRAVHRFTKDQRSACQDRKHEIDRAHLRLQNLAYERNHIAEQIKQIQNMHYRYQELDLGADLVSPSASVSSQVRSAQHQDMLRRLANELSDRNRRLEELTELQQRRDALSLMTTSKRQFANKFAQKLATLVGECESISKFLGTDKLVIKELLPFLPAPLSTLATLLKSAVSGSRSLSLELVGDAAAARNFQPPAASSAPTEPDADAAGDDFEGTSSSSNRGGETCTLFPLRLELRVQLENDAQFVFSFMHASEQNAIAVAETLPAIGATPDADSDSSSRAPLLKHLLGDDAGASLGDTEGTRYRWLRQIAGLDPSGPRPGDDAHATLVRSAVDAIVARCRTHVALEQFAAAVPTSGLSAAKEILPASAATIGRQLSKSMSVRKWVALPPAEAGDCARVYTCTLAGNKAAVALTIEVQADYPASIPSVTVSWSNVGSESDGAEGKAEVVLRAMEAEACAPANHKADDGAYDDALIATQLVILAVCLHAWERKIEDSLAKMNDSAVKVNFDVSHGKMEVVAIAQQQDASPADDEEKARADEDDGKMQVDN